LDERKNIANAFAAHCRPSRRSGQAVPAGDRELQATLKERTDELENINCEQREPVANTI